MDGAFSRWYGQPGGELLGFAAAQDEEEAMFGALPSDTRVTPEQIRVDCFGEVAVSTFTVFWRGPDRKVMQGTMADESFRLSDYHRGHSAAHREDRPV